MANSKTDLGWLYMQRVATWLLVVFACSISKPSSAQDVPPSKRSVPSAFPIDSKFQSPIEVGDQIAELIQQLGSDSYATRQRAQSELAKFGLSAFDQLRDATFHPDPQIAATSRYLIQSVDVAWVWETDSLAVRQILSDYGVISQADRARRILQLAGLANDEGLTALCRLARYESRGDLGRRAAVCILQSEAIDEPRVRSGRVAVIRQVVNSTGTDVCRWLMRYADELESSQFDGSWWSDRIDHEYQLVVNRSRETNRPLTVEFTRWVAEHAAKSDSRSRALAIAERSIDLVQPNSDSLLDYCYWVLELHLPELVSRAILKHPQLLTSNPRIGYALAESLIQSKNQDTAAIVADMAFKRALSSHLFESGLGLEQQIAKVQIAEMPKATPAERRSVADGLRHRSLYAWSEREYASALDGYSDVLNKFGPNIDIYIRVALNYSDMLQDGQEYQKAADIWKQFVARIEMDSEFRRQVNAFSQNTLTQEVESILGQYYYFLAKAALDRNDSADALQQLAKAYEADPLNSDVLIAMYRLDGDSQWKAKSREQIEQSINRFYQLIQLADEKRAKSNPNLIPMDQYPTAMTLNQLAWLLGNIDRNTGEAVKIAERAVEIVPNAAHIDTLGRCYFANGQYEIAVRTQRRAVKMETSSRQMQRQLELFEQRLASPKQKIGE